MARAAQWGLRCTTDDGILIIELLTSVGVFIGKALS